MLHSRAESGSSRKGGHDVMLTDFENMALYQYHENILHANILLFAIK